MTAKTKTPRAARKTKAADALILNHAETLEVSAGDEFAALLADLGAAPDVVVETKPDAAEVIEPAPMLEAAGSVTELLEAVVSSAEATEAAAAGAAPDAAPEGAAPTDGAVFTEAAASTEAKKERTPRKHYSDKVERLKDRVGDKLGDYSVLTVADAPVDDDALAATMERTLNVIRAMNKKEQNRASNFIEFLSGKKAKLNNVLERVLKVLERDGQLTTGNEGNVIKDLLARPYSLASARAMGGNTLGMFADLKVIVPDGKGKFLPNPDSLLLMKAKSLLAAPAASAETTAA